MQIKAENYSLIFWISFRVPRLVVQFLLLEHTLYPPTASPQDVEGNVEPGVECAAHLQHLCVEPGTVTAGSGMCVYPLQGKCVPCLWGPRAMPSSTLASPLFEPSWWKIQGKKVVLPALGDHTHCEIPACKYSSQHIKIGKYIYLKSSFPAVRRGGMKGGGLDVYLSQGQAACPRSKQPGQGEIQTQQAAGQESLL